MAVIRSMTTKEADHGRATYYMRTGYMPTGPIQYPPLSSIVSKELGSDEAPLPNCVSIAPYRFFSQQHTHRDSWGRAMPHSSWAR